MQVYYYFSYCEKHVADYLHPVRFYSEFHSYEFHTSLYRRVRNLGWIIRIVIYWFGSLRNYSVSAKHYCIDLNRRRKLQDTSGLIPIMLLILLVECKEVKLWVLFLYGRTRTRCLTVKQALNKHPSVMQSQVCDICDAVAKGICCCFLFLLLLLLICYVRKL